MLIEIREDGTARMPGRETGKLTVRQHLLTSLVLHEEGHTYWSGIGCPRGYAPAQYHVYTVKGFGPGTYDATLVTSFPVKR